MAECGWPGGCGNTSLMSDFCVFQECYCKCHASPSFYLQSQATVRVAPDSPLKAKPAVLSRPPPPMGQANASATYR
ncbi:hypothetical protein Hamer_G012022 [Homarus americanus]|uniref:Uncharacterized protein n=1 Tax=Homarus americanus TaxID=6706 RepID=A0A8J5MLR7_HOMAM|nr:hypothetical protein Hamer_G012022 [Homarus americanus]